MQQPIERVDLGQRVVARRARVNAEAHELFRMIANPHRHHEADGSGTVKPEVIGPRELHPGDRFRVSMKMFGIPYAITSTATRIEPDRVVEWQHPAKHRWRWEFEQQEDGSTIVTEAFDYSDSRAAGLLERAKVPARNSVSMRDSLARLQRRFGG